MTDLLIKKLRVNHVTYQLIIVFFRLLSPYHNISVMSKDFQEILLIIIILSAVEYWYIIKRKQNIEE